MPNSNTPPVDPKNVFHIHFDSIGESGYMKGVKVTIEEDVLEEESTYRLDLANHPLYKKLQQYVRANPR